MDRRSFLRATGAAAVALPGAAIVLPDVAEAAARRAAPPVFSWGLVGGFIGPNVTALRPPRLVVYRDHTAIADATRQVRLTDATLAEIVSRGVDVLSNPANTRRRPGVPIIADAPSTQFEVRELNGQHRHYSATVEALGEYRDQAAYPKPLYDLLDDATGMCGRTLGLGRPYRPAAVRVVVMLIDQASGPVRRWPSGVPVPSVDHDTRVGQEDLRGTAARRIIHAAGSPPSGQWPTLRVAGSGALLQVAWRYLLPHEGR